MLKITTYNHEPLGSHTETVIPNFDSYEIIGNCLVIYEIVRYQPTNAVPVKMLSKLTHVFNLNDYYYVKFDWNYEKFSTSSELTNTPDIRIDELGSRLVGNLKESNEDITQTIKNILRLPPMEIPDTQLTNVKLLPGMEAEVPCRPALDVDTETSIRQMYGQGIDLQTIIRAVMNGDQFHYEDAVGLVEKALKVPISFDKTSGFPYITGEDWLKLESERGEI